MSLRLGLAGEQRLACTGHVLLLPGPILRARGPRGRSRRRPLGRKKRAGADEPRRIPDSSPRTSDSSPPRGRAASRPRLVSADEPRRAAASERRVSASPFRVARGVAAKLRDGRCAVRHRWEPGLANSYESLHLIMAMSGEPFGRPPDGKKYLNIPVFTKANGEPETAPFINDKNPRLIAPCWRQGLGQHHGWKVGAQRLTIARYLQARGLAGEQATRWKANVTRACFRLRSKADWALIGE